jgi:hypothetical protein
MAGCALAAVLILSVQETQAQSMPLSNYRAMNPQYFIPATFGLETWHRFDFLHQQRGLPVEGFETTTEYFNYISPAFGKSNSEDSLGIFGWGLSSYYEKDFTDTRFLLRPSMAVRIVNTANLKVALGGSVGLVFLGQNFDKVPLIDRDDPELTNVPTVNYLDVSLSGDIRYQKPGSFVMDAQIMAGEMRRTAFSFLRNAELPWETYPASLPPSLLISGGAQYEVNNNLLLGPRFFFQRIILDPNLGRQISTLDLGVKADFKRPQMWLSGSYLINGDAFRAGIGMQFNQPRYDTTAGRNRSIPAWAFNLGFTVPTGLNANLGAGGEIGVALMLPTKAPVVNYTKVFDFSGAFWKSDADLLEHLRLFLRATSPPGLVGHTFIDSLDSDTEDEEKGTLKTVKLIYEFPDNSETYLGDEPEFSTGNLISKLGAEWEGVDNLMDNLMSHVVQFVMHPDSNILKDVTNDFDSLQYLAWIEISTTLQTSHDGAKFGTEAGSADEPISYVVPYKGDLLSRYGNRTEPVPMLVLFDEEDLRDTIYPGDTLTDLRLAMMKQYALRKRIQHQIQEYFGDTIAVNWEENSRRFNVDKDYRIEQRQYVFIRKLSVSTGHTYQKERMRHRITLNFIPYPGQKLPKGKTAKSISTKETLEKGKKAPDNNARKVSTPKETKPNNQPKRIKKEPAPKESKPSELRNSNPEKSAKRAKQEKAVKKQKNKASKISNKELKKFIRN